MEARKHESYLDRITSDSAILRGKPIVKGTRIPVDVVLTHLAEEMNVETLFEAYPRLSLEDVKACLDYARTLTRDTRARRALHLQAMHAAHTPW